MSIEIKSVKIKDSKPIIEFFQLDENGEHEALQTYQSGPKCHPDFEKTIEKLKIHLAMMTYYLNPGSVKKIDTYEDKGGLVESFSVGGYYIGGKEENQNVIIVGGRKLPNGKYQGLNSPLYLFAESDESGTKYKFMEELQLDLIDCEEEAKKYISGEKVWKDPQLKMELEESEEAK